MLISKIGELGNSIGWFNHDGTGVGVVLIGVALIFIGFFVMYKISKKP